MLQLILPSGREAEVTGILLAAHTTQVLEDDNLSLEELEPPPIDPVALGLLPSDQIMGPIPTVTNNIRDSSEGQREKRAIGDFEPFQCSKCSIVNVQPGKAKICQVKIT